MSTIPASLFVEVHPSVLAAGGSTLDIIGLFLTESTRVPIGSVLSFPDASAVGDYFGGSSDEKTAADNYFSGFDGASRLPGAMLWTQYNSAAVAAYLRGGDVSDLSLAELQSISGTLTLTVDGYAFTGATISLAAASSFSAAATSIESAINAASPTIATITAALGANITGAISGTTMTVSAVASGLISVGDTVTGSGVTAGTTITALGSGTGGTGTYTITPSQTVGSEALVISSNKLVVSAVASGTLAVGQTIDSSGTDAVITALGTGTGGTGTYTLNGSPQRVASGSMTSKGTAVDVTYDSTSGAFVITSGDAGVQSTISFATGSTSTDLKLTSATGAVLSQGAAAASPAAFMDSIIAQTTNWASFTTIFDPDASGHAVKAEFAAWNTDQNDRYAYICWDTDITPTEGVPASSSLGAELEAAGDSGTSLIYAPTADEGVELAAFICGAAASIDFAETNGRITFAYKSQSGITATVTDQTVAVNLGGNPQTSGRGNGYNYYGAVGAANANFAFFQRGFVTGDFAWLDSYINQIWLNNALQLAGLQLMANARSIPFGVAGNTRIEAALADPINAGLSFGAFGPGTISSAQIAAVNSQAGTNISETLQTQGWYLQVPTPSSAVRAARGPINPKFWYLDRGSIQSITLSSIAVQ